MKTEIVALTFPDQKGAEDHLKTLIELLPDDPTELKNLIVIEKDKEEAVKVTKLIELSSIKCCTLDFVVALLLGSSIAEELLGEAAGTMLVHQVDLGIPQEKIDLMLGDMVAGSSTLFVQDYSSFNGVCKHLLDQSSSKMHNLSITEQTATKVDILVSTLQHYWN